MSEGQKVGSIMKEVPTIRASQAKDGDIVCLAGRIVVAGDQPFVTPADGKPCVWYKITVSEERINWVTEWDAEGNERKQRRHNWVTIAKDERYCDFYLQDGHTKIFVNGRNHGQCKAQIKNKVCGDNSFTVPPWGVAALVSLHHTDNNYSWASSSYKTGRFRYTQHSLEVNELIAGLGVVEPMGADPYTGAPVKALRPITKQAVQRQFPDDEKMKKLIRFVKKNPAVLLSDDQDQLQGFFIPEVVNLPPWMTTPMTNQPAQLPPQYQPSAPPFSQQQPGSYRPPQHQQPQQNQPYAPPQHQQPQQNQPYAPQQQYAPTQQQPYPTYQDQSYQQPYPPPSQPGLRPAPSNHQGNYQKFQNATAFD